MRARRSANLGIRFPGRVVRERRDAVRWLVVFRRNGLVPDDALPLETGRAVDFLRWLIRGARPIRRPSRGPVCRGEKWRRPDEKIVAAGRSLLATFLHTENAIHNAGQSLPVHGVLRKLFASFFGNGIKLGLAVVGGNAPGAGDPSALLQPH